MKALWNQIKFQKDLYLTGGIVMLVMFAIGTVIHDIIMASENEAVSVFYMGSMLAISGLFMMMFFFAGIHMVTVYNYAVSMGQSRKRVFPAYTLASFSTFLVFGIVLKLLHALEGFRLDLMFKGWMKEDITGPVLEWKALLMFALVGTAMSVLLGASLVRFGRAAFWVWWVLLILVCIGGPRLVVHQEFLDPDGAVMDFLTRAAEFIMAHTQMVAALATAVVTVVFLGAAYLLLRRHQVNL